MRIKDLTGQTFGRWTVLARAAGFKKRTMWECVCSCSKIKIIDGCSLVSGNSTMCRKCSNIELNKINPAHKDSKSRLFTIYKGMLARCTKENLPCSKYYVLRGVNVCPEWNSFDVFKEWAVANGYAENLSIDRVNNDGNYSPENCRWATRKTQARNNSGNLLFELNGEEKCLAEWADESKNSYDAIYNRLRNGWSLERALNTDVRKHKAYKKQK